MEIHFNIIGIVLVLLAAIHAVFPSYFHWKSELSRLSLINRQVMWVHTFFIAFMVLAMGSACMCCAEELLNTAFGKKITFFLAIFWTLRLFVQFFVYSRKLWWGKRFETLVHIVFSILWIYFSTVFWLAYFY